MLGGIYTVDTTAALRCGIVRESAISNVEGSADVVKTATEIDIFPLAIVISINVSVPMNVTLPTLTAFPPLTMMFCPVPSIVAVRVMAGRVLPNVIVPLRLNSMVCRPVSIAQSPPV